MIFYLFSLIFIWNELYLAYGYDKLGTKASVDNFNTFTKIDLTFYITRVFYWIWITFGLSTQLGSLYVILICLASAKILAFFISRSFYRKYDMFHIYTSVLILSFIFIEGVLKVKLF